MTEPAIRVKNLHRMFGDIHAVRGLSFEVSAGQVVGFIGANGAGKTTTMRMMVTLESPSSGSIEICGYDVQHFQARVRERIGWMPDAYGAYEYMTVHEYLDFYARAFGYVGRERTRRLTEVMEFTDLVPLAQRYCDSLSKGMGQRLCLGRMLLHDPSVLILDEPAAGLDPKARVEFKHLIRLLAKENKTIFLSSHILSELEDMCDNVLFIDDGKLLHHGSTESLKRNVAQQVIVVVDVAQDPGRLAEWVAMNPGVQVLEETKTGCRIIFEREDAEWMATVLRAMVQAGLQIIEFRREQRRLEDAFIEMLAKSKNV